MSIASPERKVLSDSRQKRTAFEQAEFGKLHFEIDRQLYEVWDRRNSPDGWVKIAEGPLAVCAPLVGQPTLAGRKMRPKGQGLNESNEEYLTRTADRLGRYLQLKAML